MAPWCMPSPKGGGTLSHSVDILAYRNASVVLLFALWNGSSINSSILLKTISIDVP